jgi:hypothetical protein
MNEACKEQWGSWYTARWEYDSCNGWKCYSNNGPAHSIDVNRACRVQYPNFGQDAFGQCPSNGGWDDWLCWVE